MLERITKQNLQSKSKRFTQYYFKLLIIVWLFVMCCGSAFAQKPANFDSLSYRQKMDIMFAGIKKDSLKTGILIDRVVGLSEITEIGSDSNKIDTVSESRFLQVIFELERAVYDTNSFLANAGEKIRAAMGRLKYSDSIPIAIIDIEYETLKDSALLSGILRYTADSLLETTPNDFRNPFEKHTIKIAVVLESTNTIRNQGFFKIEPSLYFSNTNTTFQKLNLNFITISYELTSLGTSVKFDKNIIGENASAALELRFQNNTGELLKSSSKASFPNLVQSLASDILPCNADKPYKYFGEPFNTLSYRQTMNYGNNNNPPIIIQTPNGPIVIYNEPPYLNVVPENFIPNTIQGAAFVSLYPSRTNSTCSSGINKVVIILDGFDPLDDRDENEFYNQKLKIANTSENLGEKLRDKGFDIAFVNFPNLTGSTEINIPSSSKTDHGAGFIEANAFALIEVLKDINNKLRQKGSNEPISIVGPSMGGLISRYALAYMEKRKAEATTDAERLLWEHNCHLFISFDVPHLGANIPIGLQQFLLNESISDTDARSFIVNQINTPAARQLLINHIDSRHSADIQPFKPSSKYRDLWMGSLLANGVSNSGGFPKNCRIVTISNGSEIGKRQQLLKHGQLLRPVGGSNLLNIEAVLRNTVAPEGMAGEVNVRALSDDLASTVTFRKWTRTSDEINLTFPNIFSGGSLDLTSGGYFPAIKIADEKIGYSSFSAKVRILLNIKIGSVFRNSFDEFPINNFIPIKSSLGFKAGINGLSEDLSTRDLVCSGEIPFDDYYIEDENSEHVFVSQGMADYAIAEIEGFYHQRPVKIIRHSRAVCDNEVIDFNYTNIDFENPAFTTVITPILTNGSPFELIPIEPTNNTKFRVRFKQDLNNPNAHFIGPWTGTLNFTITRTNLNPQPGKTITCITQIEENFHIGGPDIQTVNFLEFCQNETKTIVLNHAFSNSNIFQVSSSDPNCVNVNNLYTMAINGTASLFYAKAGLNAGCSCTLTIIGSNDCGSVEKTISARVFACRYASKDLIAFPPFGGPSTEQIEIQVVDDEGVLAGPNVTVELSDSRGTVLKSKVTNANSTVTFEATNLPLGRYVFSGTTSTGDIIPSQSWIKQGQNPSVLLVSPNPAIKGVDQELVGNLLGVDETKGPFKIKISNTNEVVLDSVYTNFLEFQFPITNLEEGLYLISACNNKDSIIAQEYITLGIKARPSLRLTQNPVNEVLKGYVENAVEGYKELTLRVRTFGGVEVVTATGNADDFEIDVNHLPPGSYFLTANDGKRVFSIQFQKN